MNLNIVNCVLLVVYCVVKQNENFDFENAFIKKNIHPGGIKDKGKKWRINRNITGDMIIEKHRAPANINITANRS